jgi:hypothetical protein
MSYGQCDALVGNRRCKKSAQWFIPCTAVYDARCNSYRADEFKPVRLCECHGAKHWKNERKGKRLPLIEGGFLGSMNKYNYGNLVLDVSEVDWETITELKIPKYWSQPEIES